MFAVTEVIVFVLEEIVPFCPPDVAAGLKLLFRGHEVVQRGCVLCCMCVYNCSAFTNHSCQTSGSQSDADLSANKVVAKETSNSS